MEKCFPKACVSNVWSPGGAIGRQWTL
jgi:hypothetical protein